MPHIQDGPLGRSDLHLLEDDADQPHQLDGVHTTVKLLKDGQLLGLAGRRSELVQEDVDLGDAQVTDLRAHLPLAQHLETAARKVARHAAGHGLAGELPVDEIVPVLGVLVNLHKFHKQLADVALL